MIKKQLTPLLKQYLDIKEQYHDCLIFFRLGDFYELFFEDAEVAAKELNITLTKRGQLDNKEIPMCGVPFFQGEVYLARLLKKGFKVAICEQMERPEESKKRGHKEIIKRKVVRVATPGTLTEEKELESPENNFLASLMCKGDAFSLAWIDISTGEISLKKCLDINQFISCVEEIRPSEIIYNQEYLEEKLLGILRKNILGTLSEVESIYYNYKENIKLIHRAYDNNKDFKIENFSNEQLEILGSLVKYISYTQDGKTPPIKTPNKEEEKEFLEIDVSSKKNLEIVNALNGDRKGSLLDAVNYTKTSTGERKLINDLLNPLTSLSKIKLRQELVEFFFHNYSFLIDSFSNEFSKIPDFSRSIVRLSLNRGGPRDLSSINSGLRRALIIVDMVYDKRLANTKSDTIKKIIYPIKNNKNIKDIKNILDLALEEKLPLHIRDGGFIKKGYDSELDSLINYRDNSKKIIIDIELKERLFTKINNLRIKYNNFLGYFIEVSPMQQKKVRNFPERYIHRQTLKNCIRFTSRELVDVSEKIINSNAKLLEKEIEIYKKIVNEIINNSHLILKISDIVARLDVALSWATYAKNSKSVKPSISEDNQYSINNGRHPSVEKTHSEKFIPNSCVLNKKNNNVFKLITGPNMSGKSTFLRQNAIILIMAQAGGFCPADSVKIGICDKLFCRVGSGDELAKGNSTFMVEMLETARILQKATINSLVILDEIGRGTSTYDGMSIAWATIEYLVEKIKCKTLFATHYNELGALKEKFPELELNTFRVKEWKGDLVFLHEINEGVAASSYGIQVAKMAGIPNLLTERAEEILKILETKNDKNRNRKIQLDINYAKPQESSFLILNEIKKDLINLNINKISPIDALNRLNKYKEKLFEGEVEDNE